MFVVRRTHCPKLVQFEWTPVQTGSLLPKYQRKSDIQGNGERDEYCQGCQHDHEKCCSEPIDDSLKTPKGLWCGIQMIYSPIQRKCPSLPLSGASISPLKDGRRSGGVLKTEPLRKEINNDVGRLFDF